MSYHPAFAKRDLMRRLEPGFRATAERHRAPLQEVAGGPLIFLDLGAGREVAVPAGPPRPCAHCWQQRIVWEMGTLGLVPLRCERCSGSGWDPT